MATGWASCLMVVVATSLPSTLLIFFHAQPHTFPIQHALYQYHSNNFPTNYRQEQKRWEGSNWATAMNLPSGSLSKVPLHLYLALSRTFLVEEKEQYVSCLSDPSHNSVALASIGDGQTPDLHATWGSKGRFKPTKWSLNSMGGLRRKQQCTQMCPAPEYPVTLASLESYPFSSGPSLCSVPNLLYYLSPGKEKPSSQRIWFVRNLKL